MRCDNLDTHRYPMDSVDYCYNAKTLLLLGVQKQMMVLENIILGKI